MDFLGIGAVELADHVQDLAVADDGGLGMAEHHIAQSGGVVGLHVVDEDIVQFTTAQSILQIFKELGLDGPVHRVKQHGLLIQQQVGVEGHPTGNRMGALEQGVLAVVSADPNQIFGDMTDTVHIENPSFW